MIAPRKRNRQASPIKSELQEPKRPSWKHMKEDTICENCRQIDFEVLFTLDAATLQRKENKDGVFIADLGHLSNEDSTNPCSLCQLFRDIRIPEATHGPCALRAFSFLENSWGIDIFVCLRKAKAQDQPQLAVVPSRYSRSDLIRSHFYTIGHLFCWKGEGNRSSLLSP
jgi:hypothetical protein